MSSSAILDVEGLRIGFAGGRGEPPVPIVDAVGFTLERGRTLCLVGESGCGKSLTALAIMGLLERPQALVEANRLRFSGEELLALAPDAMRSLRGDRMAMIFQEPMAALNPVFTIGRQITEIVRRHRPVGRAEAVERAAAMLERVRMPEPRRRLGQYPHELSGGMRQRAMIAMALVNGPELLLADEPTTALDVTIQAQILTLIREMQEETGTAVLLITHDLGVVAEIADEVAVMYAGTIVESAPVAALFGDAQHPYTLGLMSARPQHGPGDTGRLASIAGTVPAPGRLPPGCRFATRCPFVDRRCEAEPPPLRAAAPGHRVACWKAPLETAAIGRERAA